MNAFIQKSVPNLFIKFRNNSEPEWIGQDTRKVAQETLIPDIICVGESAGNDYFIILDAKYYIIQLEKDKTLSGNPGVEDVIKEYCYELAFKDFIEEHKISVVRNCFIMPTEDSEIVCKGTARMEMLESLGLANIQVRQVPASLIYQNYLANTHLNISILNL